MGDTKGIWIALPLPPSSNQRIKFRNGQYRRAWESSAYQKEVKLLCMAYRMSPFSGNVEVNLSIYRKQKRGDIDRGLKDILDALQGFAYIKDSQIEKLSIRRSDEDPSHPRVMVSVIPL